jgi:hypothetical protein
MNIDKTEEKAQAPAARNHQNPQAGPESPIPIEYLSDTRTEPDIITEPPVGRQTR